MHCPTCNTPFYYTKTSEDYGFLSCENKNCSALFTSIRSLLYTKKNWWFAHEYRIIFKRNDNWFYFYGPVYIENNENIYTALIKIINTSQNYQEESVFKIDYFALPTNEDFDREFKVLLSKFDRYFNKLIALS